MEEYIIVDGYNILNYWNRFTKVLEENFEDAREELIQVLLNYSGYKKIKIILVFDGYKSKNNLGSRYEYKNMEVVYSPENVTADMLIEKEIRKYTKDNKVYVATSDALEQGIILGKGALRMPARELIEDIEMAEREYRKEVIEPKKHSKNYLENNIDYDTFLKLESIRRGQK